MSNIFQVNTAKVSQETIDGEVMIINLDEGYYYSLINTGAEIWEQIEQGLSKEQITSKLLEKYDSSKEEIEVGVNALIKDLEKEEIILSVSNSGTNHHDNANLQVTENGNLEKTPFEFPKLQKYTDMQDLLTLDPIHDVDETGWPNPKQV